MTASTIRPVQLSVWLIVLLPILIKHQSKSINKLTTPTYILHAKNNNEYNLFEILTILDWVQFPIYTALDGPSGVYQNIRNVSQ